MAKSKIKKIKAKDLDEKFERDDENVADYFEVVKSDGLPELQEKRKVSADLPLTMVKDIAAIAARTGNSQNAVIRSLLDYSLEQQKQSKQNEHLVQILSKILKEG